MASGRRPYAARLRATAGETIAETLVAILVASLSLSMLASAVASATSIVRKTSSVAQEYFVATDELAAGEREHAGGTVTITPDGPTVLIGSSTTPITNVYWNEQQLPGNHVGVSYGTQAHRGG